MRKILFVVVILWISFFLLSVQALASSSLFSLCISGTPEEVKEAIESGADVNAKDNDDKTPLMEAVMTGKEKAVKLLLEAGANVNAKDKNGEIPLLVAVENGYVEVVKLLLDAGADVNAKDGEGNTLFQIALSYGTTLEILRLLLERGFKVNEEYKTPREYQKNAPIMIAARTSHPGVIKLLLEFGADVNLAERLYSYYPHQSPLIEAAQYNSNPEVVKILLEAGANPKVVDVNGKKAIDYADGNPAL